MGRKVWVYWYEQRLCQHAEDHASVTERYLGHSARPHTTGAWYQAEVKGVEVSSGLLQV
jgi:hypothetical protein